MNADKEYTIATYDRLTAEHGADSVQLADSRKAFQKQYKRDVLSGKVSRDEMTLDDEAGMKFDRWVRPERDRRAKGRHGFAENIATSLLGNVDPHLDLAVPIGDGTDKVLRYWTRRDWLYSIQVRERAVQDAADSSDEHKGYALQVIESLDLTEALYTGDLFDASAKDAA